MTITSLSQNLKIINNNFNDLNTLISIIKSNMDKIVSYENNYHDEKGLIYIQTFLIKKLKVTT